MTITWCEKKNKGLFLYADFKAALVSMMIIHVESYSCVLLLLFKKHVVVKTTYILVYYTQFFFLTLW